MDVAVGSESELTNHNQRRTKMSDVPVQLIVAAFQNEDEAKEALAEAETDLITAEISADIAEQLDAGHEVAYSAISSEEGFATDRIAVGEDELEGASLVVDDTGVYESQFIATPEGFAVELIAATDEGVVDEIIVGIRMMRKTKNNQSCRPRWHLAAAAG